MSKTRRWVIILLSLVALILIGLRRAFPVACYLAYAFEKMAIPAMLLTLVGVVFDHEELLPLSALLEAARRDVAWLRGLQVMAVVTRAIAVAAFIAGLVFYARRR